VDIILLLLVSLLVVSLQFLRLRRSKEDISSLILFGLWITLLASAFGTAASELGSSGSVLPATLSVPLTFLTHPVLRILGIGVLMGSAIKELIAVRKMPPVFHKEVLDCLRDGVLVLDKEQNVLYMNLSARKTLAALLEDDSFLDRKDENSDIASGCTNLEQLSKVIAQNAVSEERQLHTVEGKTFEVTSHPILSDGKGEGDQVLLLTDISNWHESGKAAEEFVSTVSHEFRTPLTSIRGYLDLVLEDDELPADERHKYLSKVHNNARHLTNLLTNILDLSRIISGTIPINIKSVPILPLLAEVTDTMSLECDAKDVNVHLAVDDSIKESTILSDRDFLVRILSNLMGNACKYTPSGGQVTLSMDLDGDRLKITVQDTGIGIPEDEQDRIFTRFFRGTNSRSSQVKGTGLGLAITKSLVELLGGEISFTSKVGKGSTFNVWLPGCFVGDESSRIGEVQQVRSRAS